MSTTKDSSRSFNETKCKSMQRLDMHRTLAVGITLTSPHGCRLRGGDAKNTHQSIPFHCVVSHAYAKPTNFPLLRVPCSDGQGHVKHESCACKTYYWFKHAPTLYPKVRFIAIVEDDSIVHYAALLSVLQSIDSALLHVWMSLFQWCSQEQKAYHGKFCGTGAGLNPHLCRYRSSSVTTTFASGGFDLRSRALVELTSSCSHVNFSRFGSCDGGHGVHLAKCMHKHQTSVDIYDFGWQNWAHSSGPNVIVWHNAKNPHINTKWNVTMRIRPRHWIGLVRVDATESLIFHTRRHSFSG